MGHLKVGQRERIPVEDRTLAHLKVVILTKLRRHEGLAFSWEFADPGSGRHTIWISPASQIEFSFDGSRPPSINRAWLDLLMVTAQELDGLRIVAEPPADSAAPTGPIPTVRI